MKVTAPAGLIVLLATAVLGQAQQFPECTRELLRTDECSAVVNPSACYNQFRWNTRTLGCIDGANDAERKKRVRGASATAAIREAHSLQACKCCSCVGTAMCNWVTQNRYCSS
jgi:hypothetical protein